MFFFVWSWLLWAIIINGLMAGWVYSDSRDRGDKDPGGWVAAILILGVFGLIIYLFKRRPRIDRGASTTIAPTISSTQEASRTHVPRFWKIWIGVAIIAVLLLVAFGAASQLSVVLVKIDHSGSWSGALGYDSSTRSIDGFGPATYRISLTGMRIVTAVIQKGSQYGTLTVSITTEDGRILARESTSAPYGVVTVTWSG